MIFTNYWKVLVLDFLEMGNTVFFWAKKLMERWYLLITEKFLFWTFWRWEIPSFFEPKSWWKDDIYLAFLSFPWYSRTWEIWLFVQCAEAVPVNLNSTNTLLASGVNTFFINSRLAFINGSRNLTSNPLDYVISDIWILENFISFDELFPKV